MSPRTSASRETAAMALVDGDNGMGHLVKSFAAKTAISKAKQSGVAWMGARMSNHAGPASPYATMPLAEGIIGLLAGTLNGAAMGREVVDFNKDDHSVTNTGHAIVAIDLVAFGDAEQFRIQVDRLVRDIRASKRLPGLQRIWLPGEQSQTRRIERMKIGIPLPPQLLESLNKTAAELGVRPLA